MKILLCDDDPTLLADLKIQVKQYMRSCYIACSITATTKPMEIMNNAERYDLALLDIQMAELDGLTLARELQSRNAKIVLFFITNFESYQDPALDLHALRFFKKPVDPARLKAGLNSAMETIDGAYVTVFVGSPTEQRKLFVDDILYITSLKRKLSVVTNTESIPAQENIDWWEQRLPQRFFYRVHKSFLVNLHHVARYTRQQLQMEDGTFVSIAPLRQADFRKYWFSYLRGEE